MPRETTDTLAEGSVTQGTLARLVRQQIVRGEFSPGSRLPTRTDLKRQFGTTSATVQRAFNILADQGFVHAEGPRGTFVSRRPPHLHRYALAFPEESPSADTLRFWSALSQVAVSGELSEPGDIPQFFHVRHYPAAEDARRLLYEMQTHQLAGVIFTFNPNFVAGTPLMQVTDIPMVAVMGTDDIMGVPAVKLDYESFFSQALDELQRRGRRRVAALCPGGLFASHRDSFCRAVQGRGMVTHSSWWLPADLENPPWAASYAELLMNPGLAGKPDALIVADDNFTEHALLGLVRAGARLPEDVVVVAHSNFPALLSPAEQSYPVKRIGFSAREILLTCMSLLDLRRAGGAVPSLTNIKAVLETELA